MKALDYGLMLMLCLSLTACPENKSRDPVRTRGTGNVTPGGTIPTGPNTFGGRAQGQVTLSYGQQPVQMLLSATPEQFPVGEVNGIIIEGDIQGQGIMQALNGQGAAQIAPTSWLGMLIFDSMVGQPDQTGQPTPPIGIFIGPDKGGQAAGSIQGGQANLTFRDAYGQIFLQGNVNAQTFSGEIYFQNNGMQSQPTPLGHFQIATCGFFRCQ